MLDLEYLENLRKLRIDANKPKRKKYSIAFGIFIVSAAINALLILITHNELFFSFMYFSFIACVFTIVIYVSSNYKNNDAMADSFKVEMIDKMIADKYSDYKYSVRQGIKYVEVVNSRLVAPFETYKAEDYVASSYKNTFFYSSDVYCYTIVNNGEKTITDVKFKGRIFVIDVNRNLHEDVKVISKRNPTWYSLKNEYEMVETESIEFNEHFRVFTKDPKKAFYTLTPQYLTKMINYSKAYNRNVSFSFDYGKFYIAINDSSDHFELDVRKPFNEENLQHIYDQLQIPLDLIDMFKADKI